MRSTLHIACRRVRRSAQASRSTVPYPPATWRMTSFTGSTPRRSKPTTRTACQWVSQALAERVTDGDIPAPALPRVGRGWLDRLRLTSDYHSQLCYTLTSPDASQTAIPEDEHTTRHRRRPHRPRAAR